MDRILLLAAALLWGGTLSAQRISTQFLGAFSFMGVRYLAGFLSMLPIVYWEQRYHNHAIDGEKKPFSLVLAAAILTIFLTAGTGFQQLGMFYTTAGKAGFITAFYIIIVPLLGLFFKKRCGLFVWLGVALAIVGLYFLCITESLTIQFGDFLIFICAILFSIHILIIDYFTLRVDGVKMSCIQFFVCGLLCAVPMLLFETPDITQLLAAWKPVLYAGIMSSGVAYTLQIVGQKGMNPTVASLILSLEAVVSVLAGFVMLDQQLTMRETMGCAFMFCAIVLAQLPQKNIKNAETVSA